MTASFLEGLEEAISKGTPDSRERALWHATDLLMVGRFTDEEVWVFGEVIGRLAAEIELAARAKLAAKLSRIDHGDLEAAPAAGAGHGCPCGARRPDGLTICRLQ